MVNISHSSRNIKLTRFILLNTFLTIMIINTNCFQIWVQTSSRLISTSRMIGAHTIIGRNPYTSFVAQNQVHCNMLSETKSASIASSSLSYSSVNRTIMTMRSIEETEAEMGRPFTLPPGQFKPKQSLGQNFLSDQNYARKIVSCLSDDSEKGNLVVEIGPGLGALTRLLYPKYPHMRAIEIDERAIEYLKNKMPNLQVCHMNALDADWAQLAADRKGKLNVIGNLPYYIVSQILFSLVDHYKAINTGVFTMQLEVAERIVAKPGTKQYGIPSIIFQLFCQPTMNFKIPPTVFYPVPKVDSALVTLDFNVREPTLDSVQPRLLRRVVAAAFNQRRKMLRQSLKDILSNAKVILSERWATKRPEQLTPLDFIHLTIDIYGAAGPKVEAIVADMSLDQGSAIDSSSQRATYASDVIWRRSVNVKDLKDDIDDELDITKIM